MQITAILLVLVSAFTHAGWNLIGKNENPNPLFFLWALFWGNLLLAPIVCPVIKLVPSFPSRIWVPLVAGGLFQSLYYAGLSAGYRKGELSVVYPTARALPLVFVSLGSFAMGKGDNISALCLVGCFFIVGGCFFLPLARVRDIRFSRFFNNATPFAIAAAIGTVGYSFADDFSIRALAQAFGKTQNLWLLSLLYLFVQNVVAILALLFFHWCSHEGSSTYRAKQAAITGVGITGTYSLVLTAMNFASDVTYIVAFRQLSIPIGAVLGILLFKEANTAPKYLGLLAITLGLLMVALG